MRLKFVLPVALFVVLAIALGVGLTLNPRAIPSALIGKPAPQFSLPPVQGRSAGFSTADLKQGEMVLVNVFASWCVPCREEHPLLMDLARSGTVKIYGINQRDRPDDAERWLAAFGDPYVRAGADLDGRASIDWGVYGVPETFLVDSQGCILAKHISVLTRKVLERDFLPIMRGERAVPRGACG